MMMMMMGHGHGLSADHNDDDDVTDSNSLPICSNQIHWEDPRQDESFHQIEQVLEKAKPKPVETLSLEMW